MRSKEILRSASGETSETKYEGGPQQPVRDDSQRNPLKKKFRCRVLHRKFTIHQQVFNIAFAPAALRRAGIRLPTWRTHPPFSLTRSVRPITLKSSMHSRICMALAASLWLAPAAPALAESTTLFRVFLNDGTAIVSYGEYARVGDGSCSRCRSVPSMRQPRPIPACMSSICRCPRSTGRPPKNTPSRRGRTITWRPAPSPTTPRSPERSPRR